MTGVEKQAVLEEKKLRIEKKGVDKRVAAIRLSLAFLQAKIKQQSLPSNNTKMSINL